MAYILSCNKTNKKETYSQFREKIGFPGVAECLPRSHRPSACSRAVTVPSCHVRYKEETRSLFARCVFYAVARSIKAQM